MYEKIDKFLTTLINNIVVTILIFVLGIGIFGTYFYNNLDFKYATEEDYKPLYKVQESVINDFDTVYTFSNTDIDLTDSNIIVSIYGDGCYIKTYFDKTKTYQNTVKIDNTDPLWFTIFIFILATFLGSIIFYLFYLIFLLVINSVICKLSNIKAKKNK